MKYTVYTTRPAEYASGKVSSFIMSEFCEDTSVPRGWVELGEVDFTPTAPESDVRDVAVKELDRAMQQKREDFTHGMEELQRRKEELLAITHQPKDKS